MNIMNLDCAKKLDLQVQKTVLSGQKTDGLKLETYSMVVISFSMENKEGNSRFFKKTFLLADISKDIILGMTFFILNNTEINFVGHYLH